MGIQIVPLGNRDIQAVADFRAVLVAVADMGHQALAILIAKAVDPAVPGIDMLAFHVDFYIVGNEFILWIDDHFIGPHFHAGRMLYGRALRGPGSFRQFHPVRIDLPYIRTVQVCSIRPGNGLHCARLVQEIIVAPLSVRNTFRPTGPIDDAATGLQVYIP